MPKAAEIPVKIPRGKPTPRQLEVLAFLVRWIKTHAVSPTYQDIRDEFGFQFQSAFSHVAALERYGFVERTPGVARGIRVTPKGLRALRQNGATKP